jgi:hypothetical protein
VLDLRLRARWGFRSWSGRMRGKGPRPMTSGHVRPTHDCSGDLQRPGSAAARRTHCSNRVVAKSPAGQTTARGGLETLNALPRELVSPVTANAREG